MEVWEKKGRVTKGEPGFKESMLARRGDEIIQPTRGAVGKGQFYLL
jgi:hypothetical protein